jgi:hypothetical protein
MCFASWSKFTEEFTSTFCPENEATTALMRLESNHYFQGKQNVEVYINESMDLVDLSGYTNPIAIVVRGTPLDLSSFLFLTPFSLYSYSLILPFYIFTGS